jgi:hypothetical protein
MKAKSKKNVKIRGGGMSQARPRAGLKVQLRRLGLGRIRRRSPARIKRGKAEFFIQLDALRAEVIAIWQRLASVKRELDEIRVRLSGRTPKLRGVIPTQFLFDARPHAGGGSSFDRKKNRVEDRAISSAHQRSGLWDWVQCPNHGTYPHCVCGVHASPNVGYVQHEIPRIVF